jgi:hypothetical protein
MIMISSGMIALFFIPFIHSFWIFSISVLFAMAVNTFATLKLFGSKLPKAGLMWPIQIVFTPLYFTFLTILGFCRVKVRWKERSLL